jgi:hypothetical protein
MPQLEALVLDLDRAAATLRGPMPYALEPLAALHLTRAQDDWAGQRDLGQKAV